MAALWAVNAIGCTAYAPPSQLAPERQETVWAVYLGTPQHDASAAETLAADPRPRWRAAAGRAVRGSPAVGETVIAVATADRQVVLVDRATGQVVWRAHLQGPLRGGPLLDGDRLYVATETAVDGRIYALRLKDGRTVWSTRLGGVRAALALEGDTLYAATETGVVQQIAAATGKAGWRRQLHGTVRVPPIPAPDGIAVATTADSLYLLDRGAGTVRKRVGTPGTVLGGPALAPGGHELYFGTANGHLVAIALPELTMSWDAALGDAVLGAPAVVGDTVYALTRDGKLWLVPRATAVGARSLPLDIVTSAGPTPLTSGVLAGSVSGEVVLVDPVSGAIRWRAQIDGPIEQPPLVCDRDLVVVGGRGDIHVYR